MRFFSWRHIHTQHVRLLTVWHDDHLLFIKYLIKGVSCGLPWAETSPTCCHIFVAGCRVCSRWPLRRKRAKGSLLMDSSRFSLSLLPSWSGCMYQLCHQDESSPGVQLVIRWVPGLLWWLSQCDGGLGDPKQSQLSPAQAWIWKAVQTMHFIRKLSKDSVSPPCSDKIIETPNIFAIWDFNASACSKHFTQ